MELRQLTTFRMVAATLSFSRAADALNYVQSSVTAQIQGLEEELGARLFDRLGKRVALTDAGTRLLPYAEKMLGLADEARMVVIGGDIPTGSLSITAPESICTYCLPALLRQFHESYPQVKLLFRPNNSGDLRRCVSDGEVDVAFTLDEPVRSTALVVEQLSFEPLVLLAGSDYPLAKKPVVSARDLEGESFLLTEFGCTYRNALERELNAVGIHASSNLDFSSVEAIKQCTMAAMGITFLPTFTVRQEIEDGRLIVLNWEGRTFSVLTQMLWHKDKWLSPALQAFLTVARDVLTHSSTYDVASRTSLEV